MQSGLDSVVYLRLLWLNVTAFSAISLCTFPLLSWVDWKAHNKGELWSNVKLAKIELNDFSITGVEDRTLYWHVFAAYIITASFCGIIYWSESACPA